MPVIDYVTKIEFAGLSYGFRERFLAVRIRAVAIGLRLAEFRYRSLVSPGTNGEGYVIPITRARIQRYVFA